MKLHPWKDVTDTAECYKVFQAVKGYSTGVYTKDDFKSKLKNIDLSDLENYRDHIKVLIKDTLKENKPVKEKPVVEASVEETVNVEIPVVEKTTVSCKKNYKVNDDVVETE